ncbi:MAG: glycosyltransferase family 4 protein [Bacteroidota bacterium]
MNILLWAPHGSGQHYWGPGISAYNLYNSKCACDDFSISLAHGFKQQEKYDLFNEHFYISNLKRFGIIGTIIFLIKAKIWINKNAYKFDVVHVLAAYETSFRPALWFKKKGVKVFCKITGDKGGIENNSRLSKILGLRKSRLKNINQLDGYIAISEQISEMLKRNGVSDEKIFKIPNGVNINRFKPVSLDEKNKLRKKYKLDNVLTILFVGGLSARKQPQNLLFAFIQLIEKHNVPDIQIVFLGPDRSNGLEINALKNLIANKRYKDSVYFFVHSDKPEDFYQMADLFCLPSKSEGMSNALLEAMACGIPSVVTPISGSVDLIKHGINGLYTKGDADDISINLLKFVKNKEMINLYSKNALETIKDNYSSEIILKKHLELFKH